MLLNPWIIFVTSRMDLSAIELQLWCSKRASRLCVLWNSCKQLSVLLCCSRLVVWRVGLWDAWVSANLGFSSITQYGWCFFITWFLSLLRLCSSFGQEWTWCLQLTCFLQLLLAGPSFLQAGGRIKDPVIPWIPPDRWNRDDDKVLFFLKKISPVIIQRKKAFKCLMEELLRKNKDRNQQCFFLPADPFSSLQILFQFNLSMEGREGFLCWGPNTSSFYCRISKPAQKVGF